MPAIERRKEFLQMRQILKEGRLLDPMESLSTLNLTEILFVVVSPVVSLSYWICGNDPSRILVVNVSRKGIVADLKQAIYKENPVDLGYVDARNVNLYTFPMPSKETLEPILRSQQILKREHLLDFTLQPLSNLSLSQILIIVAPPLKSVEAVPPTSKRLLSWDVYDRAYKKPKYLPSEIGVSAYIVLQRDMSERFLGSRTLKVSGPQTEPPPILPDSLLPPFEILYTGFGEFLDICWGAQDVRGSATLRHDVELFAMDMAQIYDSESSRQFDALRHLRHIFSHHGLLSPHAIGEVIADAVCHVQDTDVPCLFVVFKNEDAGSRSIPVARLASYQRNVPKMDKRFIVHSRLPMLGIIIIGPVVTFYALMWVGWVVCFPLTSGISCLSRAAGGDDRRALHRAFIAANQLLVRIGRDTKELPNTTSIPPGRKHIYPDITELPCLPDPHSSMSFEIKGVLHSGHGRVLYRARSTSTSTSPELDLVIKITGSYSIALHDFCASHGRAPTIRGFKRFPGGVVAIAMDYLEGDVLEPESSEELRDNIAEQLRDLIKKFHSAGYVHGDLRPPNIYHVGGEIMLVDFDWGGKVGEASYPYHILNPALSEGRDMDDLLITKEDDNRVLKRTLEHIGCS